MRNAHTGRLDTIATLAPLLSLHLMSLKLSTTLERLYEHHGRLSYDGPDDLLGVLIRTILSQQTTRTNCRRAFGQLIDSYRGNWAKIHHAPTDEIERVVSVAGLAGQKAARIQGVLEWLASERGEYSLEYLRQMDAAQAREHLLSFKGVGPKTAAFTLMYAAGMGVFPMDTHILRIARRLGWIARKESSAKAHRTMQTRIPDGEHYSAHMVLVRHGRRICHARSPECIRCPLADVCPSSPAGASAESTD